MAKPPSCHRPPSTLPTTPQPQGHGEREGVTCPTMSHHHLGVSEPPRLLKHKEALGITPWAAVTPHKAAPGVSRGTRTLNGARSQCAAVALGLSTLPPKAFVTLLCSQTQTHPMVGRDPASSPRIPGATFPLDASTRPGQGVPVVRVAESPWSGHTALKMRGTEAERGECGVAPRTRLLEEINVHQG